MKCVTWMFKSLKELFIFPWQTTCSINQEVMKYPIERAKHYLKLRRSSKIIGSTMYSSRVIPIPILLHRQILGIIGISVPYGHRRSYKHYRTPTVSTRNV